MKTVRKRGLKRIISMMMIVTMVLGAMPLPEFTMTARAEGDAPVKTISDNTDEKSFVAQVGETQFATVQAAIDAASAEDADEAGTVTLSTDVAISEPLTIPEEKTVILDLAGHTIDRGLKGNTSVADGNVITVNGSLTLMDCSEGRTGLITGGNDNFSGSYSRGGGIYVSGRLIMEGGTISGNTADSGGGVYVDEGATFTMKGGMIADNTADNGAGVYIDGDQGATFNVSGEATVTDNKKGDVASNVYLKSGETITVTGTLTGTFGVSLAGDYGTIAFTGGLSGRGTTANFTSDDPAYGLKLNSDGEAALVLIRSLTAAMVADIDPQIYTGSAITPAVTVTDGADTLTQDTDYTLSYGNNLNAAESTSENAPTVRITGKGIYKDTVDKTFTISRADIPASSVTAPTAKTGISFTGMAQALITAGTVIGGTMYYAVTESSVTEAPVFDGNSTSADKKWSTSVPTAVDAGIYKVWYMVKGDSNHNDTEAAFVITGIERDSVTGLKVFLSGWSYGADPNTPYVTGNPGKGAVTYTYYTDVDCSTKTTAGNSGAASDGAVPSKAGTYYIKATVKETKNYKSAEATAKFEIRKAGMPGFKLSVSGWNYGEEHKAPILSGVAEGADLSELYYEFKKKGEADSVYKKIEFLGTGTNDNGSRFDRVPGNKDSYLDDGCFLNDDQFYLNAGDYVLRATIPASDNYMKITAVTGFTVERSKAVVKVTGPHLETAYDGAEHTLTVTGAGTDSFNYTVRSINDKSDTALPVFSLFDQSKLSVSESNLPAPVSRTDAGTSYMGLRPDNFAGAESNYDVIFTVGQDGYVTIGKAEINTSDSNNANHYSKLMTISGLTDTFYTGEPVVVSVSVKAPDPGIGAVTVNYKKLKNGDGNDVNQDPITEAPREPGTYQVTLDVAEGKNFAAKSGIELGNLTIEKADYTGVKGITIYVPKSPVSANVALPNLPDIESYYGEPSSINGNLAACSVSSSYFSYKTRAISQNDYTTWKVTIPVKGSSRYNDYSLSVNFIAKDGADAGLSVFWRGKGGSANEGTRKITYGDENLFFTYSVMMTTQGGGNVSWNSSNPQVASVDSSGVVTINSAGKTLITATYESADFFGSTFVTLDVERKSVQITGLSAMDREYDGTAFMKVSGTPVLSGLLPGDENMVSIVYGTAMVPNADKGVGDDKTVYFSGFSISGEAAGNYSLPSQPESVSAKITPREVRVSGITAKEREYSQNDKTVDLVYTDSENESTIGLSGMLPSEEDDVRPDTSAVVGIMADDKPGLDKSVTITGLKLTGYAAKNYCLDPDSLKTKVTITKKGSDSEIPGPSEIGVVDESIYGKKDGKITGLTTAMEYQYQYGESSSYSSWMTCPEGELDHLTAGAYRFRYKETEIEEPSAAVTVTVATRGTVGQISGVIKYSDGSFPDPAGVSMKVKDQTGKVMMQSTDLSTDNADISYDAENHSYTTNVDPDHNKGLPYGIFTIEATYTTSADGSTVSKTASVFAETDNTPVENRDIIIPGEGENESRTEVGDLADIGLSTVYVEGLDEAANGSEFKDGEGRSVSVTDSVLLLNITSGGNESTMDSDEEHYTEKNSILTAARSLYEDGSSEHTKASFFEVDLKAIQEASGHETAITETGKVLQLILPYDFTDCFDVMIWRYYSGDTEEFTRLTKMPAGTAQDPYVDKTWFPDTMHGRICIYTSKFSIYAITYTTEAQYRISFRKNDGTCEQEQQLISGGNAAEFRRNTFTRDGYTFDGWNTEADGTGTAYSDGQSVSLTSDLVLYAQWKKQNVFISYTVSFDLNGHGNGEAISSQTIASDGKVAKPTDPEDEKYLFAGWFTDQECTAAYNFDTAVTASFTLYAKWMEQEPEIVSLIFITITTPPAKTEYKAGEKFDPAGMVVSANYTDDSFRDVTDYSWTPNGNLAVSDKTVIITYTEAGISCTATQTIRVSADRSEEPEPEPEPPAPEPPAPEPPTPDPVPEDAQIWNLFENNAPHSFTVKGVSAKAVVSNSNTKSAAFFDAELKENTIRVSLKSGADRKKAAQAANSLLSFVTAEGKNIDYALPVIYSIPSLKLSQSSVTIKKGTTALVRLGVQRKQDGVFENLDLTEAEVKVNGTAAEVQEDGRITVAVSAAGKVKIAIKKSGWEKAVELSLSVKITKKDVLSVDLKGAKNVVLNTNAPAQSFSFPVYLNGEPAGDVSIRDKKNSGVASYVEGMLTVAIPKDGVKAGTYTIGLSSGEAECSVKVRVSGKELSKALKLKILSRYDVVTGQAMVIEPLFKEVNGSITTVEVDKEGFSAKLRADGSIVVSYDGKVYDVKNLAIGDMNFKLGVSGVEEPIFYTLKKVKAKKTAVSLKVATVTVPKDAKGDVIALANIVCACKDSDGKLIRLQPVSAEISKFTNVTAAVSAEDPAIIEIKALSKKSGSIKVQLSFNGGYTKSVTIKVKQAK